MKHSLHLNDLTNFSKNEKALCTSLGLLEESTQKSQMKPSKYVIQNILNFSKAHSVRQSSTLGKVEMILN